MPSFFDLQRYAATGIASPDMTAFDKMRALAAFGGSTVQTLTGIPPLSFKSDGKPLISWSMKGNGQQTGTPTPDNPVMPEFVGEKTANVMPFGQATTVEESGVTFTADGAGRYYVKGTATDLAIVLFSIPEFTIPKSVGNSGSGTMSLFNNFTGSGCTLGFYYNGTAIDTWSLNSKNRTNSTYSGQSLQKCNQVRVQIGSGVTVDGVVAPVFTDDSTFPSSFEPYGYKLSIISAGQTVPVYLGQTQTVRRIKKLVLTGNEDWVLSTVWKSTNTSVFYTTVSGANNKDNNVRYVVSDRFISASRNEVNSGDADMIGLSARNALTVRISDNVATTVTEFQTYLSTQYAAGTPVTVWYVLAEPTTGIVNEPLAKIGNYADELHSTDAGVTIPTVKGNNTLTVETELQPSEMTITYRG